MKKLLFAVSCCVFSLSYMMFMLFICFQEPNKGKIIFTVIAFLISALSGIYSEEITKAK